MTASIIQTNRVTAPDSDARAQVVQSPAPQAAPGKPLPEYTWSWWQNLVASLLIHELSFQLCSFKRMNVAMHTEWTNNYNNHDEWEEYWSWKTAGTGEICISVGIPESQLHNLGPWCIFFYLPFETSPWATSMLPRDKGRAVKIKRRNVSGISQKLLLIC